MNWSLRLFRVKRIEIRVHVTFVLILIWAAFRWGIALGAGAGGALFGVAVTLLLFACVTLHELAHSYTAMRYGVKVRDITLLPIGGLARMESIPERPEHELKMALAGPLTNLAIALVLVVLSILIGARSAVTIDELYSMLGSVSWYGMVTYLIMANLALGLFNLVPAFPMDGGRVLRAFMAMRLGQARATALAVRIGQGLSWVLGLFGFMSGIWTLVLIAVFINIGAGQEGRFVEIKNVLGAVRVRQATSRQMRVLAPHAPLSEAIDAVLHTFQADFPVVEEGRLVGLLTETDLLAALKEHGADIPVGQVMRTEVPTIGQDEPLFEAQQRMSTAKLRALPVVMGDRLVGLLTAEDISETYRVLSASPHLLETTGDKERRP